MDWVVDNGCQFTFHQSSVQSNTNSIQFYLYKFSIQFNLKLEKLNEKGHKDEATLKYLCFLFSSIFANISESKVKTEKLF